MLWKEIREVLLCRLRLHSFTMGLPHISPLAYCLTKPTLSRTLSIRMAGGNYVNHFSKSSTQKCRVLPPSHISLAKATHRVRPNFKGATECNLNLHPTGRELEYWPALTTTIPTTTIPQRGCEDQMNHDMKVLLKTTSPIEQWVLLLMSATPPRIFKTFATLKWNNLILTI